MLLKYQTSGCQTTTQYHLAWAGQGLVLKTAAHSDLYAATPRVASPTLNSHSFMEKKNTPAQGQTCVIRLQTSELVG